MIDPVGIPGMDLALGINQTGNRAARAPGGIAARDTMLVPFATAVRLATGGPRFTNGTRAYPSHTFRGITDSGQNIPLRIRARRLSCTLSAVAEQHRPERWRRTATFTPIDALSARPLNTHYAATKAAATSPTRNLGIAFASVGRSPNRVAYATDTIEDSQDHEVPSEIAATAATGHFTEPGEILDAVAAVVLSLFHPALAAPKTELLDPPNDGRAELCSETGCPKYESARYRVTVERTMGALPEYWGAIAQALRTERAPTGGEYPSSRKPVFRWPPFRGLMLQRFLKTTSPHILTHLIHYGAIPFVTTEWRRRNWLYDPAPSAKRRAGTTSHVRESLPFELPLYIPVKDGKSEVIPAGARVRYVRRIVQALRRVDIIQGGPIIVAPPLRDEPLLEMFHGDLLIGNAYHVPRRMIGETRQSARIHCRYSFFRFDDLPLTRAPRVPPRFWTQVLLLVERRVRQLDTIGLRPVPFLMEKLAPEA